MKNIYLLGGTGSIGEQTLDVIRKQAQDFKLVAVSGYSQLDKLKEIIKEFSPKMVVVKDASNAEELKKIFSNTQEPIKIMAVLAHREVGQQTRLFAIGRQVVEGAHRHVELVADAIHVEHDLRGIFLGQEASQSSNHSAMLTDQPAAANAKSGRRHGAQSLPAMGVTNGAGQRIGGIGSRCAWQAQKLHHHVLHLFLGRLAVADHRLLDLQRRVFGNRQPGMDQRAERRTARLAKEQRRLRVDVDEHLFDRRLIGCVGRDDLADAGEKCLDSLRQRLPVVRLDAAARHIDQLVAVFLDDAKAGHPQTRVDAEDARRAHFVKQ